MTATDRNCFCLPSIITKWSIVPKAQNRKWYVVTGSKQDNVDGVYTNFAYCKLMSQASNADFKGADEPKDVVRQWREFCSIVHKHSTPPSTNESAQADFVARLRHAADNPEPLDLSDLSESESERKHKARIKSDDCLAESVLIHSPPSLSSSPTKTPVSSATKSPAIKKTAGPSLDISSFPECAPFRGTDKRSRSLSPSKSSNAASTSASKSQGKYIQKTASKYYIINVAGTRKVVTDALVHLLLNKC
ncbi:hypothetical protein VKT23_020551 [Stygiomarasmius scandens]|uniref:Uncharacterized protein n=1 Tax=Marasmiellus scandens TaxID=2682957 RepID=A0ABR1IL77_9AGAR